MADFFPFADANFQPHYRKEPIFTLHGVDVHYGKVQALRSIELSVHEGEFLFITGASGAGKSTLLRVLAGAKSASRGQVLLPPFHHDKFFICYLRQNYRPLENLKVYDHLLASYDPELYLSESEYQKDLEAMAASLRFSVHLPKKLSELNGGAKQKLAVLQACLARPRILLADEPTSSLDKSSSFLVYELLGQLNQQRGMTIVWASHNQGLVKQFSGNIVHLDQAKIVYKGQACFI